MRALVLEGPRTAPRLIERPEPVPGPGQVLLEVLACGVCRTDLHIAEGDLAPPSWPLVPGHQIVGRVIGRGPGVEAPAPGERVGVPWLSETCGACSYCEGGRENLCARARFTGLHLDGGLAERAVAPAAACLPVPAGYGDAAAAPLLCAGLIGYRSLVKAGAALRLGLYGFGAAAHLVIQVARAQGRAVYAFTRSGDHVAQAFARSLGAVWAGAAEETPPEPLDAAILFAPVGALVPLALAAVAPGGTVVCGGIHMSDIPSFPYRLLWGERTVTSVANLTRRDGEEFFRLAATTRLETSVTVFPLAEGPAAFAALARGEISGAAVVVPGRGACP